MSWARYNIIRPTKKIINNNNIKSTNIQSTNNINYNINDNINISNSKLELPYNTILSNTSCLDYIDSILYINLDHRHDRKEHCLNEIKKIDPNLTKVHRIDAIYNKIGALGCSLSHIKALELFIENESWKNVLILEDDFTFSSNDSILLNKLICYLFEKVDNYDIMLLGLGNIDLKLKDTEYNNIKKVLSSQTTSGYIVNRKYIHTLLANYIKSSNNLKDFGWKPEWCIDIHWKELMPSGNWFTYSNRIGYQYDNYSDIEKKSVAYNS